MSNPTAVTLRRRLVRSIASMATIGLAVHLVLPQLAGLRATGEAIARASWWLTPAVVVLEGASLAAYGRLLLTMLRREDAPIGEGVVQRTVLIGNALPGGTGTAFALVLGGFRSRGLDAATTGTAMWGAGLLSSAVLGLLLPVGAGLGMLGGHLGGHLGGIGVSTAVAALAAVTLAALAPLALRDPDAFARRSGQLIDRFAPAVVRGRLDVAAIVDGARRGAANIHDLADDRHTLGIAAGWAAANWLLDVAVVVVLALTVGRGTPLIAVLLGYVVAQLAAAVPLTPGGVGIVETAMVGVLVASGAPAAAATATVLGWRLISHWLPIPVGLVLLPGLRG